MGIDRDSRHVLSPRAADVSNLSADSLSLPSPQVRQGMCTTEISEPIDHRRRQLLGAAAITFAASGLGLAGSVDAQTSGTRAVAPMTRGTNTTFPALKQVDAGLLNVGYAEVGPADGPAAVLLLHGWPYDIYSFVDVAPILASAGYRVIVPYLRGYGTTKFRSGDTFRNGQQGVVAVDIIAFMDALNIRRPVIAAFDWARARLTSLLRCGRSAARGSSR
jgi:hypothetical protein